MEQIAGLVFSWQFLSIGVMTALVIIGALRLGEALWRYRALRGVIRFMDAAKPWIPWVVGGLLGAIPWWPPPPQIEGLPQQYVAFSMILLGIIAGALYERIWKGVKQVIEARGIDLDWDLPPRDQKNVKWKP